jgi:hypothetical protein
LSKNLLQNPQRFGILMESDISAEQFYRLSRQLWSGGRRRAGNDPQAGMYEVTGTGTIFGWSQMTIEQNLFLLIWIGYRNIDEI